MIQVWLGDEVRSQNKVSKWKWHAAIAGKTVHSVSREPLLDACRHFKSMGVNPRASAGLFRKGRLDSEGRPTPDMTCTVGTGAKWTVQENEKTGPTFVRWKPNPLAVLTPLDRNRQGVPNENKAEI